MGWKRSDLTPEIIGAMSPEDQLKYGPGLHPVDDPHPPPKSDKLEREEQRQFASWLMLNNLLPPAIWHSTAHRTKATLGCPDFVVPIHGQTLYIEMKRGGFHLSADQVIYMASLQRQGYPLYICYSALEAIELCKPLLLPP